MVLWTDCSLDEEGGTGAIAVATADGELIAGVFGEFRSSQEAEREAIRLAIRAAPALGEDVEIRTDHPNAAKSFEGHRIVFGYRGDNTAHDHARAIRRHQRVC